MDHITEKLLPAGGMASKRINDLWQEYEHGQTKEAKFVKDLDRLEMVLQAFEYEKSRGNDRLQQFYEGAVPKISHPEVKKWAGAL